MSTYKGLKSTDAEIILDLEKGMAFFDYSLNKFGSKSDSGHCVINECGNKDKNYFFKECVLGFCFVFLITFIPAGFFMSHVPKYQYVWQKFSKKTWILYNGIQTQTAIGRQSKQIVFEIACNVWFDYKLEGDYERNIKKISLLRRFINVERNGITSQRQRGWNVVFEFSEPPQTGSCLLRSIA